MFPPLNIEYIPRVLEEVWHQPNFRRMGIAVVLSQQSSYKLISTTDLRTALLFAADFCGMVSEN